MTDKRKGPRLGQYSTHVDGGGRECTSCGKYKKFALFVKSKKYTTGFTPTCRVCINKRTRVAKKIRHAKTDPLLLKSRALRGSLLARATDPVIKASTPTTEALLEWFTLNQPFTCFYTKEPLTLKTMHIDHKLPVVRGGDNSLPNLCIASAGINRAKGSMTEKEFTGLLKLVSTWEDKGKKILTRLKQGHY